MIIGKQAVFVLHRPQRDRTEGSYAGIRVGLFGKGPMVVMEKEWSRLTGQKVHRERVLPWVYYFMDWVVQHPVNRSRHAILMEDGASLYTAKLTKQLHD